MQQIVYKMHFFRKLWWWLMRAKHQKSWGLRLIREKTISQYVSSCLVEHGSLMRSYEQDIFSSVNEEVHATKQTCCPSMKRRGITKLSKLFSLLSIFIFYFRRCKKSHSISAKLMITDKVFLHRAPALLLYAKPLFCKNGHISTKQQNCLSESCFAKL